MHQKDQNHTPESVNQNDTETQDKNQERTLEKEQEAGQPADEHEEVTVQDEHTEEMADEEISDHKGDQKEVKLEEVSEVDQLKKDLEESKDKYLRLYSEFENFRRRNARERLELVKTANEDLMVSLLPIIDDFERARNAMQDSADTSALKEGVELIYNKFKNALEQKGLKAMDDTAGTEFNAEFHEAITQIPAPSKELQGKIVDVIEKGYYLNDKVVRFAKVVIGA